MSALTSYLGIPPAQEQSLHGRKHTEQISANSSEGGKEGGKKQNKTQRTRQLSVSGSQSDLLVS